MSRATRQNTALRSVDADARYARALRRMSSPMLGTPITNESLWPSGLITAGVMDGDTLKRYYVIQSGSGLRLFYVNDYLYEDGSTPPNNIIVKASIKLPSGTIVPVTFGGAATVTIIPKQWVASDPVSISVLAGTFIYVTTWVQTPNPGTGVWVVQGPPEGTTQTAWNEGGLAASGTTYGDLTGTAAVTVRAATGYSPFLITAAASNSVVPVLGITGTSITAGYGDTDNVSAFGRGWPRRALANKIAHFSAGANGWSYAHNDTNKIRALFAACCTDVLDECGINDIWGGGTNGTLATIQARSLAWATRFSQAGCRVWRSTITPYTTSTDNWATLANQTPYAVNGNIELVRVPFNNWVRDGAPISSAGIAVAIGTTTAGTMRSGDPGHPYSGWFEVADAVESSRDSGKWTVGLVCLTGTPIGIHPNSTGANAIATSAPVQGWVGRLVA